MQERQTIPVVFAGNDKFAQHICVTLTSLLKNSPGYFFDVRIIETDFTEQNKVKIASLANQYPCSIQFFTIDDNTLSGFSCPNGVNLPPLIFCRVWIYEIFPDLEKVIYLDGDMIIQENIGELYKIELGDYYFAAVEDISHLCIQRMEVLRIPAFFSYFNSGLLVMDCKKWRKHKVKEHVIDYLAANRDNLVFPEQDILNALYFDKWLPLSHKWNIMPGLNGEKARREPFDLESAQQVPAIVHFASYPKPWEYSHWSCMGHLYWKYLADGPFSGAKPQNICFHSWISRLCKKNRFFKCLKNTFRGVKK